MNAQLQPRITHILLRACSYCALNLIRPSRLPAHNAHRSSQPIDLSACRSPHRTLKHSKDSRK